MNILWVILAFIVTLGPLVILHEWGHFFAARRLGVKVLAYSIGFGPVLYRRSDKQGCEYRLSAIPLGGYVKMLDSRETEITEEQKAVAFDHQSQWKKVLIVAAGPLVNFVIAVLLFFMLAIPAKDVLSTRVGAVSPDTPAAAVLKPGDLITQAEGKPLNQWGELNQVLAGYIGESVNLPLQINRDGQLLSTELPLKSFMANDTQISPLEAAGVITYEPLIIPTIEQVEAGGAAAKAGLKPGDTILSINDQLTPSWFDVVRLIRANSEKDVQIKVARGSEQRVLAVALSSQKDAMGKRSGYLGVGVAQAPIEIPEDYQTTINLSLPEAFMAGVQQTWNLSILTLDGIKKMVFGLIGLESLSGPITIANMAGESLEMGLGVMVGFIAYMSVALGVLNLLPIPGLDGGHILLHTTEALIGNKMPEKIWFAVTIVGFSALLVLMGTAIFNDIVRLFA